VVHTALRQAQGELRWGNQGGGGGMERNAEVIFWAHGHFRHLYSRWETASSP